MIYLKITEPAGLVTTLVPLTLTYRKLGKHNMRERSQNNFFISHAKYDSINYGYFQHFLHGVFKRTFFQNSYVQEFIE